MSLECVRNVFALSKRKASVQTAHGHERAFLQHSTAMPLVANSPKHKPHSSCILKYQHQAGNLPAAWVQSVVLSNNKTPPACHYCMLLPPMSRWWFACSIGAVSSAGRQQSTGLVHAGLPCWSHYASPGRAGCHPLVLLQVTDHHLMPHCVHLLEKHRGQQLYCITGKPSPSDTILLRSFCKPLLQTAW